MLNRLTAVVFAALAFLNLPAMAQDSPYERLIEVEFSGVVTGDASDSIRIRQPDGSFVPFTGPLPDYPYSKGDQITIGFTTTVPTGAYIDRFVGQPAVDGIYRIGVSSGSFATPFGIIGGAGLDPSGPIRPTQFVGQSLMTNGIIIVYDANKDSYSLDFGDNGWSAGTYDGPSFRYDPDNLTLSPSETSCYGRGCNREGLGGIRFRGDEKGFSATNISVIGPNLSGNDATQGSSLWGFFDLVFAGEWNLPIFGNSSGGGPVDVPAPSMLLLFGGGVAVLGWRRRKATRS